MPTTFTVTLSDRLATAATRLAAGQRTEPDAPPVTAADYIEGLVKHTLRGQAEVIAAEEAKAVLAAYDSADNAIQRQVREALGIQGLR